MSTIADYLDRTFDVFAFSGVTPAGLARLEQTLLDDGGSICTGVQMLCQRWVLEFLTERTSIPYKRNRGSSFMTEVRQGSLQTEADVFSAFLIARSEIGPNLRGEELETDPDDERYATSDLESVQIAPGGLLVLGVSILSLAGDGRQVILPISVTPGGRL